MRYREPYTVFPRKLKSGRVVWYYQTYDDSGRRTAAFSTGQTCKSAARAYCRSLDKADALIPKRKKEMLFKEFAVDWWVPGKCEYLAYRMNRRQLSDSYIKMSRHIMEKNILPYFGKYRLTEISRYKVEEWLNHFIRKGISTSSANIYLSTLHIMLSEAVRREILTEDVTSKVQRLKNNFRTKGVFTRDMVARLFCVEVRDILWDRVEFYYANLLAACTGMRMGEILGLRFCDIKDDYVSVTKQYKVGIGLRPTKTKKSRKIPIPHSLQEGIRSIPYSSPDRLIFISLENNSIPVAPSTLSSSLYKALDRIGVNEKKRKEENYTFHSWRHYFNTIMRSNNIPDSKLQSMTGHSTKAMTDHYTHYAAEDLKEIEKVQAKILPYSFVTASDTEKRMMEALDSQGH